MSRISFKALTCTDGRTRRRLTRRTGAAVAGGVAALATTGAMMASAAVPQFPDNLVVFPDRDFVTVEGYQNHVGETATLQVFRGTQLIGSAQHVVDEGDVAFEVNHPGGACWGDGTDLNVTPDIQPGDRVQISFPGLANGGDTTVQEAFVDTDSELVGTTLTITGHIAAGVGGADHARTEQRIVNPELTDTDVGRRDVRALPGPVVRSDKGGYSSGLTFEGDRFTATYEFDTLETAQIAAGGGGERMMAWEVEDAQANRQGLTIAEYKEVGGPGMGGCPAGPADANPPAGSFSAVRSADKSTIQVNWTPAEAVPTAEPVSGYSIDAIGPAVNGVQNVIGARTGTSATRVTLTVDPAVTDYTVEVRSIAGAKMGEPFAAVSAPTPPDGDLNPPTVVADPAPDATDPSVPVEAPNGVTLKTDPAGDGDIYYTTDGSSAILGDLPSDTAQLYVPGTVIPVTEAGTEIHWAAFDAAGNSSSGFGTYSPSSTPLPAPDAPALTGTAGQGEVTLRWNAVDRADGYQITVYNADGTKAADNVQPAATSDLTQRVTGLTPETAYDFTVKARNSQGLFGAESEKLRLTVQKITDQVFITRARYKAGDEFRVEGTSTATSGTVNIYAVNNGVRSTTPITGMSNVTLTPAVAPATGTTFSARLRNGNVPARPQQIVAISSNGGVSPAFTVTNG